MKFSLDPDARQELTKAADWYDERRSGVGADLTDEVQQTINEIVQAPDSNAFYSQRSDVRYRQTRRFPYLVLYRIGDEQIEIVAVSHMRQKPGYWTDRLSED